MNTERLLIGLMSGTSGDAVDAVLVGFKPDGAFYTLAEHSVAIPQTLKQRIFAIQAGIENDIKGVCELDVRLAKLYAQTVEALLTQANRSKDDIEAIGNHGQTLLHFPSQEPPFTLQVGDNHVLAELTGISVVGDFRRRDVAANGQGAPLIPAFHKTLVPNSVTSVFLNIGGIANISKITPSGTTGFDVGPGNTLMDAWMRRHNSVDYDSGGDWARSGSVNEALLLAMLQDPFFSKAPPKSTGQDYFNLHWLEQFDIGSCLPSDVQRTLLELTAKTISTALKSAGGDTVFLFGGGRHNHFLVERITDRLDGVSIESTEKLGVSPDFMEATAFAWLAKQCIDGRPGNDPNVTGARAEKVLGVIFPA